ncbi:RNA polymerase sigma factor [Pinirhizobacter soli]|uniref:RNA polymerase sigma factor n=1 Tax=Pinirhizobacter soli TaxID=2786953 RepID=UPI00202A911E|nr:sigma-70 family RNA polymerase sigma factor [Pinirhizobacter soli]
MSIEPAPESEGLASQEALFEGIALEYGPALARLASAYEANSEQRRDLLQDIHIAVWRSLLVFDHRCSIRTWVYRVAHNTATTHVTRSRSLRGQRLCSLDEIGDVVDSHDTEAIANREQAVGRLLKLVGLLQTLDRQIILLYLEGLDAASIAAITGLSPGNIATKVHRIKALLARHFHAEEIRHA